LHHLLSFPFFFLMIPRPPTSTLFPYTTLFRSVTLTRAPCFTSHVPRSCRSGRHCSYSSRSSATCFESKMWPALPQSITRCAMFRDRKSTRLNSSHVEISYAVFCLKKKKKNIYTHMVDQGRHGNESEAEIGRRPNADKG